jgi:predicted PurR-regulated permease PerM
MDFPIVWGALAFLLNFIPQLGSIVFVIVVIVVGIVQFYPSITQPLTIGISMTGLQLLFGQFLDPLLSGERLDLSPVFVLASLLFWGWLWGVVGALIAVPIAATMKIVCANIPVLKPVSILLGTGYKRKLQLFKKKRRA